MSSLSPSPTSTAAPEQSTPPQGALDSAGAGITGGYTGDSLDLKIIIAFLIGLSLYNALELLLLVFVTFNKYKGVYFWSLIIAGFGVIPYALGFLVKFFQLLDPSENVGYIAVFLLTVGWYMMVSGQSVVLWSRLHLLTNSRRVLRWTLYMIIIDGILLHSITTVLTFGSNSNSLSKRTLSHFVRGYNIMEKIQMVGFCLQELVLSVIYIKETVRLLKLSESVKGEFTTEEGAQVKTSHVRKTMYQLLAINAVIIAMDGALLGVEFANLYIIETTLKGVVYSVKLKLEFAVLGKLVQFVRTQASSGEHGTHREQANATGLTLEKSNSRSSTSRKNPSANGNSSATGGCARVGSQQTFPDFVDPTRVSYDATHAEPMIEKKGDESDGLGEDRAWDADRERWRRRSTKVNRNSWIDEEMDRHNIG
ncbi:hypothetical protein EJ04DRAFT_86588 [Polyplosphaeria fusca]|uniref:DUF7703 domain-containing protein n=1 Tax=Polyplosphaeria fusca TaxID=682080 RepID=A0A9P4R6T5_9PLEO|nr:hypothetical protein EJ04DRAFT_86588 [Polyplosphaeria fusca]